MNEMDLEQVIRVQGWNLGQLQLATYYIQPVVENLLNTYQRWGFKDSAKLNLGDILNR